MFSNGYGQIADLLLFCSARAHFPRGLMGSVAVFGLSRRPRSTSSTIASKSDGRACRLVKYASMSLGRMSTFPRVVP